MALRDWNSRLYIVGQDLRFGLRQMRRSPAITITLLTTLALGIGLSDSLFNSLAPRQERKSQGAEAGKSLNSLNTAEAHALTLVFIFSRIISS